MRPRGGAGWLFSLGVVEALATCLAVLSFPLAPTNQVAIALHDTGFFLC